LLALVQKRARKHAQTMRHRKSVGGAPPPVCGYCGNSYGLRWTTDETVLCRIDEPTPPYRGNGIVLREREWTRHVKGEATYNPDTPEGMHTIRRGIWDGVTWRGGYEPFCTLRCALDFARAAYRVGCRARKPT